MWKFYLNHLICLFLLTESLKALILFDAHIPNKFLKFL